MNDFVSLVSKRQFVLDELAGYSGTTKKLEGSTFIICPFHSEDTPSGRIFHSETTRSAGFFKCYGCGKTASWNDLAPRIGLKPFKRQKPADEFINLSLIPDEESIRDVDMAFQPDEMRLFELPKNRTWRGIRTSLLTALGAKICKVNHPEHGWLKPKVYLPVLMRGELVGYIKARFKKSEDYPSYINAKGSWSKTHGLFPFDYTISMMRSKKSHTVVLVEGPRDALRLLQNGIPAVCILGTQSWSSTKSKMLELAGVNRLVIFMDGDDAGIAATDMIKEATKSMFAVIALKLWSLKGSPYLQFQEEDAPSKAAKAAGVSLWDPCSCPQWIIDRIKKTYF